MQYIRVTIAGKADGPGSSYMQDKFVEVLEIPEGGSTNRGEKPSPRDQAEAKLHLNQKGKPIIPATQIFAAMMNAGVFHKLTGKKQVSTKKESTLPGGCQIVETEIPIKFNKPWEVDSRSIVTNNGRVIKHRPRFDDWEAEFTIEVDTEIFKLELIRKLVDDAGKRIGIGSFRPICKGPFGRFVVTKWIEVKAKSEAKPKRKKAA